MASGDVDRLPDLTTLEVTARHLRARRRVAAVARLPIERDGARHVLRDAPTDLVAAREVRAPERVPGGAGLRVERRRALEILRHAVALRVEDTEIDASVGIAAPAR